MRYIFALILIHCLLQANGQHSFPGVTRWNASDKRLRVNGKLQDALHWKDKLGENVLLISKLGPQQEEGEDEGAMSIYLFVAHYVKKDTSYKLRWLVTDLINSCTLDHSLEIISGSTTITDLDNDGIAETKVQYKGSCRGDVSPSFMKVIMHEDSVKYALRGEMWLRSGGEQDAVFSVTEQDVNLAGSPAGKRNIAEWKMGRYESEKDFEKAPPAFLIFARKEWLKYARESFE